MADGIIGAISLGFQVTRELAVYYSAFKSYHSDVDAVATRIELTSNVFDRMQTSIQSLSPAQIDSLKEMDRLVIACVDSLRELERYQEKCAKHKHAPDLLKGQIESVIKRLAYPFRKSTLDGMQRTLDSLIGTVQLMTQITHIDAGKSWSKQMLLSNDQIQRDLQTVLAQQSTQVLSLNGISNQLGSTTDMLLASHSLILSQLSGLESQIKTLTNTSGSTDMVLRFPARSEVATQAKTPANSVSEDPMTNQCSSGSFLDTLQCRCPKRKYRRHYTGYRIRGLYRTEAYTHLPDCPFNFNSSVVTTIGMKIRIGLWKAAYVLETGIEYGSSYIAPHIRYRNMTPISRSPMFKILFALQTTLCFDPVSIHTSGNLRGTLDFTTRALVAIFQQGRASIYDVDECGFSVLHSILNNVGRMYSGRDFQHILNNFVQSLVNMGAEMNIKNCYGRTPLENCLHLIDADRLSSIFQDNPILMEMECSSSSIAPLERFYEQFSALSTFKMLANSSSNGIVSSPLMMSLLQESQSDLQRYLKKGSLSEYETDIQLLAAALTWPDGLRQLIAHGVSLSSLDELGCSILDIAIDAKNALDTVQYLLGLSTSLITPNTWHLANRSHRRYCNAESIKILFCIAVQLSEHHKKSLPVLFNEEKCSLVGDMYHTLYHSPELTVAGAQALYDNGFTEIDYEDMSWGTPLLFQFSRFRVNWSKTDFVLLQWFLAKLKSLDTFHAGFHGNYRHFLAQSILESIFQDIHSERFAQKESMDRFSDVRSLVADMFSDPNHDCCTCFCSTYGCDIITFTLKRNKHDHGKTYDGNEEMFQDYGGMSQKFVLTEVFGFLGIHLEQHPERVHSALRIMTFDRLDMTHTCMQLNKYRDQYYDYTIQERSDIHHAEKNDIDALERLLTHFESEWSNYNGTFLEFLESHWEPHMEQVLSERRAIPMNKEVLDECNVRLIEYGPEEMPGQNSDDIGHLKWFQRVVEAIVDGREVNREDRGGFF